MRKERLIRNLHDLKTALLNSATKFWWAYLCGAVMASGVWLLVMLDTHTKIALLYGWAIAACSFAMLVTWIPVWVRESGGGGRTLFTVLMLFLSFALLLMAYVRTDKGAFTLEYLLFALAFILVPAVMTVKIVLDEGRSPSTKALVGLLGYLFCFAYMIWLVGLYVGGREILTGTLAEHFVTVLSTGAEYALSYHAEAEKGLVPLVGYLIGFLFNTVTVGFFISYWASLLYADLQDRRHPQTLETPATNGSSNHPNVIRSVAPPVARLPDATGGCSGSIKGITTAKGRRFYYVPGSPKYDRVKPTYCFATERDAQDAGFLRGQ